MESVPDSALAAEPFRPPNPSGRGTLPAAEPSGPRNPSVREGGVAATSAQGCHDLLSSVIRNLTAISRHHEESFNNYSLSSSAGSADRVAAAVSYHGAISVRQMGRHLRRKNLAINCSAFGAGSPLKPDKTHIF